MLKLAGFAVSLESAAIGLLFTTNQSIWKTLLYLALHAGASALVAVAVWPVFRRYFEDAPRWPIALFFALAFFVPMLGLLGFLVGLTIALWAPKATMYQPYATVPIPQFSPARSGKEPSFRSTSVREDVFNPDMSEEVRLKALLSVQEMPARATSSLLRELLADHSDDIRLLSYGMLRNKERAINERIVAAMDALKDAKSDIPKFQAAKELAELNWELVYQNLVVGDMRRHSLNEGLRYIDIATALRDDDPGVWYLASRLAFRADQLDRAGQCMEKALENGYPRTRALSNMAELAYARGELVQLRALMAELPESQQAPQLVPVAGYWCMPIDAMDAVDPQLDPAQANEAQVNEAQVNDQQLLAADSGIADAVASPTADGIVERSA